MRKNAFFIILLLSLAAPFVLNAQTVLIKGKLKGFEQQVQLEDYSEYQYLRPPKDSLLITTDTTGNFQLKFNLLKPGYFRLGRNVLYLSPNDRITVYIDHTWPDRSTFAGRGAPANNYLRYTPFPKGGSFLNAGKLIKPDIDSTLTAINAVAARRKQMLDTLKGVSAMFRLLETARIQADIVNSINAYAYYFERKLKLKGDSATQHLAAWKRQSDTLSARLSKNLLHSEYLSLAVVRDLTSQLIHHKPVTKNLEVIKDWLTAEALADSMRSVSNKLSLQLFESRIKTVRTPGYRKALSETLSVLMAYGNGDLATDFEAIDLQGKPVHLSDLKGKVIYIDLWATWCGPCLAEMPALETLKTHFGDNISFVSISIDNDTTAWLANVKKRAATGLQWHTRETLLKDYQIKGIPRIIIIGPDFHIVEMKAPIPSSALTYPFLKKIIHHK